MVEYPVSDSAFTGHRVVPSCCCVVSCVGSECPGRIRQSVHRAAFRRPTHSPAAADSNTCPGGRFIVSVRLDANRIGHACLRPPVLNAARDSLTIAVRIGCCGTFAGCLPMLGGGGSVGRLRLDLLVRVGGGTTLLVPPAATSGHPAMDARGYGPNVVCRCGGCS